MEALRALHKAKKFKQMDLKKSVLQKGGAPLSKEEATELKLRERLHRAEAMEMEKLRRKEQRLKKLREMHEQKRRQKLREKEWLKPREDLLCTDSKVTIYKHVVQLLRFVCLD